MNREQRRRAAKKGVTDKDLKEIVDHNVSSGYNKGKEVGRKEGIDIAVNIYSTAVAYVMREKMLYGKTKTLTTMKQIQEAFDKISTGELSIQEIEADLKDDVGLVFTNDKE